MLLRVVTFFHHWMWPSCYARPFSPARPSCPHSVMKSLNLRRVLPFFSGLKTSIFLPGLAHFLKLKVFMQMTPLWIVILGDGNTINHLLPYHLDLWMIMANVSWNLVLQFGFIQITLSNDFCLFLKLAQKAIKSQHDQVLISELHVILVHHQ